MNEKSSEDISTQMMLNKLSQHIWVTDFNGQLKYVNETLCHELGSTRLSLLDGNWQQYIHPEDFDNYINLWNIARTDASTFSAEVRIRFADGIYYWHLITANRVIEEQIWLGSNTNIHSQKSNEYRQEEFISIASHELKTPLTTIKGYTQLILRQIPEGPIQTYLQRSAGQLNRLEKLISDLLDVSKINAGKMVFSQEQFHFTEMLKEAIANMQAIAPGHQIDLQSDAEYLYTGDRFRLEQVVQNFLSNAIKYSPNANRVLVSSTLQDGNLIVSVTDYGIGIPSENLGKLFERYYRADNSSTKFDGLGLGLFISAEIIKRHSGSFWIDSEVGKGSTFAFKLPLAPDDPILAEIQTDRYYKDRYITISCTSDDDLMFVEWTGYQDMRSVKHGGSLMIEYLRNNKRSKVFNDNRLVPGTWSEASDWAAETWLPAMERAGLKYFAWVLSASAFSQLSAHKSVDNEEKTSEILFFHQATDATDWLESCE